MFAFRKQTALEPVSPGMHCVTDNANRREADPGCRCSGHREPCAGMSLPLPSSLRQHGQHACEQSKFIPPLSQATGSPALARLSLPSSPPFTPTAWPTPRRAEHSGNSPNSSHLCLQQTMRRYRAKPRVGAGSLF